MCYIMATRPSTRKAVAFWSCIIGSPIICPVTGQAAKTWHNQLYTLAGDIQVQVQGTQAPQTVEWGQDQMQIYTNTMKVFKLTEQRTLLVGVIDAPTLEAAVADSFV
jgi:hypothetical protein